MSRWNRRIANRRIVCAIALVLCAATSMVAAQETRRTETNAAKNPADDAKPNSSAVPDVYAITGHLEPGTQVFTFAIITIGVMNDADLSRVDDETYR